MVTAQNIQGQVLPGNGKRKKLSLLRRQKRSEMWTYISYFCFLIVLLLFLYKRSDDKMKANASPFIKSGNSIAAPLKEGSRTITNNAVLSKQLTQAK